MDADDKLEAETDLDAETNLNAAPIDETVQLGMVDMLKNAKALADFAGEHNCERAEQLANELITELKKEAAKKSLCELKQKLAEHDDQERDDFADDGTLGKIWGMTLKASGEVDQFTNQVLSSWRSHYHKAMEYFQDAIKGLANRWDSRIILRKCSMLS